MGEFDRVKNNNDVIVEQGQLQRMRDPRSGQIKEVDMSLAALSRTMEQIRKSADIINQPSTGFDMAINRFAYIKELVLDHAHFSPKLQNLQIKIMDRVIEVVKHIEELDTAQIAYTRNYFISKARAELAKEVRSSKTDRKKAIEKALEILNQGYKHLKEDEETIAFVQTLKEELEALS